MSATLLNMPSPQLATPYSESTSGPGTPMSGISTIAIKDGHEGNRPSGEGISAADRISRLGGYFDQARNASSYATSSAPSPASNATTGSTVTTEEAIRATKEAKMIDGMTYDEGVVDTTDRAPVVVLRRRQGPGSKEVQQQQQEEGEGEVQEKL